MGMWQGINKGFQAIEDKKVTDQELALRVRSDARSEEAYKENRLLKRKTNLLEVLGDRGKQQPIDKGTLAALQARIGNVEGSEAVLSSVAASPTALTSIMVAITAAEKSRGVPLSGEDLLNHIEIIDANKDDLEFMRNYKAAGDIRAALMLADDSLLNDERYNEMLGQVVGLPTDLTPSIGVNINPKLYGKIPTEYLNEQVKSFDSMILEVASGDLDSLDVNQAAKITAAIKNYKDNPAVIRNIYGYKTAYRMMKDNPLLFENAISPQLKDYIISDRNIEALITRKDDPAAKAAFDSVYGTGMADYILSNE